MPDLQRLRRFALASALALLTYTLAAITLDPEATVSPLGVRFRIGRPELLPVGLALATLYGMIRFYYYGMMLGTSPYRKRRDVLDSLAESTADKKKASMYCVSTTLDTVGYLEADKVDAQTGEILGLFPKFARGRVRVDRTGTSNHQLKATITIPRRCHIAALFEDLDYTAPVWFSLLALMFYGVRLLGIL